MVERIAVLVQEFRTFRKQVQESAEMQVEQHRKRTFLQGHSPVPVKDRQRPGQEDQQNPAVQPHSSSRCELRQTKLVQHQS